MNIEYSNVNHNIKTPFIKTGDDKSDSNFGLTLGRQTMNESRPNNIVVQNVDRADE